MYVRALWSYHVVFIETSCIESSLSLRCGVVVIGFRGVRMRKRPHLTTRKPDNQCSREVTRNYHSWEIAPKIFTISRHPSLQKQLLAGLLSISAVHNEMSSQKWFNKTGNDVSHSTQAPGRVGPGRANDINRNMEDISHEPRQTQSTF